MADTEHPLDVGGLVAAIAAAADDIAALSEQVTTLEAVNQQAEAEHQRLRSHLEAVLPRLEATKGDLRAATSAADQAEATAAAHLGHADQLSVDLATVHSDLKAIETAVEKLSSR